MTKFLKSPAIGACAALLMCAAPAAAGSFDNASTVSDKPLSGFDRVYIAPVVLDLQLDVRRIDISGTGDRPVSDTDAANQADNFYDALLDAFGDKFRIEGEPGPGVLTIAPTLTSLESSRPTQADYRGDVSLSFRSVYAGGGAMTAAFSEAGVPLGEVSDKFDATLSDTRTRAGTWDDTRRAFRQWSRNLVKHVERN